MKLTPEQTAQVKDKLDLNAVDETQDVQKELEGILGEHTFFINDKGLFVFESETDEGEAPGDDAAAGDRARLFVAAVWSSEEMKELTPVNPPAKVDVVFDFADGTVLGGR